MRKTYEVRLRPTKAQEQRLVATLAACRYIYNWGIEDRKVLWQYCHVSTNFHNQSRYLKHLKDANPWLKDVHAHPLQDALRRVERSFDRFFKTGKTGHGSPRFKDRNQYDRSPSRNGETERRPIGSGCLSRRSAGFLACRVVR